MAEQRLDALYPGETRARPLRIIGAGGLTLFDGERELVRPLDSKAFIRACLSVQAEQGAAWANKLLGTW